MKTNVTQLAAQRRANENDNKIICKNILTLHGQVMPAGDGLVVKKRGSRRMRMQCVPRRPRGRRTAHHRRERALLFLRFGRSRRRARCRVLMVMVCAKIIMYSFSRY